jgi:beta-glucosidase
MEAAEQSPETRQYQAEAEKALSALTLKEKVALMSGSTPFWSGLADIFSGGYSRHSWLAGEAPRLGVPGIRFIDGPRGVILKGATTFPVSMARGAAWDAELEERIGDAIGREVRACGANLFGGVCINLLRHPAWGRAQETYGEDSFHVGIMGAALARGVERHAMACVKHYACNSMENARFTVDVHADARALREVYLAHFRRVIDAGASAVMTAYNRVNGAWCGQSAVLIRDILKGELGFEGFTLTDFIFGMRDAKTAILAGQDLEMPFRMHYDGNLERLVAAGEVPAELVDDAARRILRQEFRFAAKPGQEAYPAGVLGCEAHRQLALEAAGKSIVLLKNADGALPLGGRERLAVIGRLADTPNTGDGGSSNTQPAYVITPLQGLREELPESELVYDDGADPARAARVAAGADAALVVVGYTHLDEGEYVSPGAGEEVMRLFPPPTSPEDGAIAAQILRGAAAGEAAGFSAGGDRQRLELRPEDEALILAVAAANPRTIVAVMAGSAVITEAWRASAAAILMLWYPGMEGGRALARILSGRVNPSGRLPCTFPRRSEDLPAFDRDAASAEYDLWHGYRKLARDGASAAFPFGFGLSYTTFAWSGLEARREGGLIRASLTVANTGRAAGEEVVQLYARALDSRIQRPPRELKAFARVHLAPGAGSTVALEIPVSELAYYDIARGWIVEPGRYALAAARHAEDPGLEQIVMIDPD